MNLDAIFNLDLLILGIGVAGIGLLGFLIFFNDRESVTNRTFLFLSLATIAWGVSNFFEYKFDSITETLLALRFHLFLSVWHAFFFFQLCYVFPRKSVVFPSWYRFGLIPALFLVSLSTLTPFVFPSITELAPPGSVTDPERGPGLIVFSIVAFGLLGLGISSLIRKLTLAKGVMRSQLFFITLGMSLMAALILAFNVVLPVIFKNLTFIPYAALFMLPFIGLTSYTIYQHKLFNIKVFAAGVLVFFLAAFTFVEVIFTQETSLLVFRSLVLILVIMAGTLLLRSVMREVEQREKIALLAQGLRDANEKLKELDRLKSQFLSIASHDLRAPLTTIRNFLSLLLDGTYGKMPPAAEEGMHQIFNRATDMAKSVETYLNVSRIEQGRMKYDFEPGDFSALVRESAAMFKPIAEKKGLEFSLNIPEDVQFVNVKLDRAKMNEVVNNLIDNSIKYTPKGSLRISLARAGENVRLTIADTGVGMSQTTIGKLFKLFSTGDDSRKVNTSSTGVGLYISKSHVEAHGGKVWAESDGEGKGSRFIVELPILPK